MGVEPTQDGITAPQTVLKTIWSKLTRERPEICQRPLTAGVTKSLRRCHSL